MPRRIGPDGRLGGGGKGAGCGTAKRWAGGLALATLVIHLNTTVLLPLLRRDGDSCQDDKAAGLPVAVDARSAPLDDRTFHFQMRSTRNDTRHGYPMGPEVSDVQERCARRVYNVSSLPRASVIIAFHETERLHDMMHTLHSMFQTTDHDLIHEVILVDDASHSDEHGRMLENYISTVFPAGKVWIVHSQEPLGLIAARAKGIEAATGEVYVVLDAHMELQPRWLEALLYEIARDPRVMLSLYNDYMKQQQDGTWIYEHGLSNSISVWEWYLLGFTVYFHDSEQERQRLKTDPTLPVKCTASVGHWAMHRDFYEEIGGLDTEMKLWGGENIDLAIRTFLFGGTHYLVPCSHAAHLERPGQKVYRNNTDAVTNHNLKRIVHVWFDEYREQFYHYNHFIRHVDPGPLDRMLAIKQRAPRTFRQFMEEDYPQLGTPQVNALAYMGVQNAGFPGKVLFYFFWRFGLWNQRGWQREEEFYLSPEGHLRHLFGSIDILEHWFKDVHHLTHNPTFNQTKTRTQWLHRKGGLLQARGRTQPPLCLTVFIKNHIGDNEQRLVAATCNVTDPNQRWTFRRYSRFYVRASMNVLTEEDLKTDYLKELAQYIRDGKNGTVF